MIRRRKIQARPNLATALANPSGMEQPKPKSIQEQNQGEFSAISEVNTTAAAVTQSLLLQDNGALDIPIANNNQPLRQPLELSTNRIIIVQEQQRETSEGRLHMTDLQNMESQIQHRHCQLQSQLSHQSGMHSPCVIEQQPNETVEEDITEPSQTKKRREPLRDKLCDTKKFTMADLITWRPKTENTLRKKWAEKRKELRETMSIKDEADDDYSINGDNTTKSKQTNDAKSAGPRVKINEHGEMVVDEESLVIVENPENNILETVNEDLLPKKVTSLSFKKFKKGAIWSVLETDLFYEVLAATGTDFGLMHDFIPTRSRIELKMKFNREQRTNASRVDETMRHPTMLDERLRQRADRILSEITGG